MESRPPISEFRNLPYSRTFETLALPHLIAATGQFFGGAISYCSTPMAMMLREHEIDLTLNPGRGVYQLGPNSAIILGRVLENRHLTAVFSLQISKSSAIGLSNFANIFEAALALSLSRSNRFKFEDRPQQFGEDLVELSIAKYFSKGYYDYRQFLYLIKTFHKLSNTTFEGRNFTTGLILTRSFHAFSQSGPKSREGQRHPLKKNAYISPGNGFDKRLWYLADGQTSFFVCDKHLRILDLFLLTNPEQKLQSFVDDYSLGKTVKGGDALFRVTSRSEFSIAGSGGMEFNFKEGQWRVRNLKSISEIVKSSLGVDEKFVQCFLYFIFYLARRRLSAILWVPKDLAAIDSVLLSKNELTEKPFSILDEKHTRTLLRLLASDGVSIIGVDGSVISYGSVIDTSKIAIKGVKGTGESVSALLSQNGLSVKISQDGNIKLLPGNGYPSMII
ncbi:hypothetical protein [Cupriavidus sp. 8B]